MGTSLKSCKVTLTLSPPPHPPRKRTGGEEDGYLHLAASALRFASLSGTLEACAPG